MKNNFHLSLSLRRKKNHKKPLAIRSHCVGKAVKVKFGCGAMRRLIEVLCLLISRSLSYKEKSNISHLISGPRNSAAAAKHTLSSLSLRILRCVFINLQCVCVSYLVSTPRGATFFPSDIALIITRAILRNVCVFGAHAPAERQHEA